MYISSFFVYIIYFTNRKLSSKEEVFHCVWTMKELQLHSVISIVGVKGIHHPWQVKETLAEMKTEETREEIREEEPGQNVGWSNYNNFLLRRNKYTILEQYGLMINGFKKPFIVVEIFILLLLFIVHFSSNKNTSFTHACVTLLYM